MLAIQRHQLGALQQARAVAGLAASPARTGRLAGWSRARPEQATAARAGPARAAPARAGASLPEGSPQLAEGRLVRALSCLRAPAVRCGRGSDQFVSGGGVLGALVVAPPASEPGEPHRQPGVFLDLPPGGGVGRGEGQLGAENLKDQARFEPHVGLLARVDPGGLVRPGQRREPAGQRSQVGVGEAGAALGHRAEEVGAGVVGGQQQRAVDAGPAATPGERADDRQVDGVGQLGAVVALELDPQPATGACGTRRRGSVTCT